ncbi:MAG TPA: hypothetical protein VF804_08360 [Holophagaceae bacterium]
MRPRLLVPCLALLWLPVLRADGLSDLRAALKALPAQEAVRAKIEQDSLDREEGAETRSHRTTVVEDGPGGMKVLEDTGAPAHPEGHSKSGKVPGTGEPDGFRGELRAQEELLKMLEKARLREDRMDSFEGRPARRLRLALDLNLDEDARRYIKRFDQDLVVWLDPQNLPLALDLQMEVRARAMLFFSVRTGIRVHERFQRYRDRLITAEARTEVEGVAVGKAFGGTETTRCSLIP